MLRGPVRLAHTALAWVWTTALGRLVVPEVNMIPNGSIGSAGRPAQSASSANSAVERVEPVRGLLGASAARRCCRP